MIIANKFVCTPPPPPPPRRRSPRLPSLPVSSKMTPTLFYETDVSTQVILRRGEGFYEQEFLYFVVFFESAD